MRLTRVTLFFIAIIMGMGFYHLTDYLLDDLESQTLQATEESMIDTAELLANAVENQQDLNAAFQDLSDRPVHAQIFAVLKSEIGINAYLTDEKGIVIFDSAYPENIGQDFSKWADVRKTLAGQYGARSTRVDENAPQSSVMYVAAPVRNGDKIIGCLTISKAQSDVLPFVRERRKAIIFAVGLIGIGILALIGAVFIWLFRPVGQLTAYARAITRGERRSKPNVGIGREVNTLANALHDMRKSLEGREYADQYIQTLTHELKSPLAAIQGASELLEEDMPKETRARFLNNIRTQSLRCETLIHRLLELSALEAHTHLPDPHHFDLTATIHAVLSELTPLAESHEITFTHDLPQSLNYHGNEPLIKSAIQHILENAIQFSPQSGTIQIVYKKSKQGLTLTIINEGDSIPDFAAARATERFYSFREEDKKKGNGLGLALVKEVAELHQGNVNIQAHKAGGTECQLLLRDSS